MAASPDAAQQSHAHYVQIPCIVFFVVTPVFIAIRLWNRISRRSGFGLDDATIIVSFLCTLLVQIFMMLSCNYGFGRHLGTLPDEDRLKALELFYIAQIFYKLTINLTKTSILLLYLRIFVQKWFRVCCCVLIGLVLSYTVASTATSIFQCEPIRGAWDKSVDPTCINITKNWYANAGYSIATDVLILLLPMQPIWASKLPINQKRALMLVFALGGFVTVTSIMRATTLNFSTTSPDSTYDISSTLWTMIEENVAIICACLPMCRIVLVLIFPKIFGGNTTSTTNNNNNNASSAGLSQGSTTSPPKSGHQRLSTPGASWNPYSGTNRSVAVHQGDDTSEEFILATIPRPDSGAKRDGSIVKTTKYEVSYDESDPCGRC